LVFECLYEDPFGKIWVGTRAAGLNRFDPITETFKRFRHDPDDDSSLSSDHNITVYCDRTGTIWVGSDKGLNRFDPETESFERFQHNWINLTLEGTASNRSAIGARVKAKANIAGDDVWQMHEISGGSVGQNSHRVHLGLRDAESVDSLMIRWPGSGEEGFSNIEAGKFYKVVEGEGITEITENITEAIDAAMATQVPESYRLSQNYPNPFNPKPQ
jgi:hypothetical protein